MSTDLSLAKFTAGVDVSGSQSGYTNSGEIRFNHPTGTVAAITTTAAGSPTMSFAHRGTNNTGSWNWANGTVAGTSRMVLSADGQLTTGITRAGNFLGTNHEAIRVDAQAKTWGNGFSYSSDNAGFGSVYGTQVTAGLSISVNRGDPAVQFRNQGGGAIMECMGADATYRFYVTNVNAHAAVPNFYVGQYGPSGCRFNFYSGDPSVMYGNIESANADCHIFWNTKGVGIHRFYVEGQYVFDVRGPSETVAGKSALWLWWADQGGAGHFTPVYVGPKDAVPGTQYILTVA